MSSVLLHIPCDVQQVDDSGYVWAFLDRAAAPERILPGRLVISGDDEAPVVARVIDIVAMTATDGRVRMLVHLDVLGFREEYLEVLDGFPVSA